MAAAELPPFEFPPEATAERPRVVKLVQPEERPIPPGESAFSLLERDIPDPVKLCDPWAIEGVNIIAGRPKLGKTTLERQKLAAAAAGEAFLDSAFPAAVRCAFLCLEEGELLCRAKFKLAGFRDAALAGIQLHFEWQRGQAGVDMLDRYLMANRDVRFVCIDSLTKFRVVPDMRVPAFIADYEAVSALHEMRKRHPGIAIDVIHHTRKAKSEDPIDDISGTYGLTAACDAYTVLRQHADGAVMHVGGRLWDREESEYKIKRTPGHRWDMVGVNLGLSDEQEDTLRHLRAAASGLSGSQLAEMLGITLASAWFRLESLIEHGIAVKRYGRVFPKT